MTEAQIEVKYHFKSQCNSLIEQDSISFELQNLESNESYYSEDSKVKIPTLGKYELSVTLKNGKYERSYEEKIIIKESIIIVKQNIQNILNVTKFVMDMK